jgi:hypothetical protein
MSLSVSWTLYPEDPTTVVVRGTATFEHREPDYKEISIKVRSLLHPLIPEAMDPIFNFERVRVWLADDCIYSDMFVDELGALPKKDPIRKINLRVSWIYHANTAVHQPKTYAKAIREGLMPNIYGPALVFSQRIWF